MRRHAPLAIDPGYVLLAAETVPALSIGNVSQDSVLRAEVVSLVSLLVRSKRLVQPAPGVPPSEVELPPCARKP